MNMYYLSQIAKSPRQHGQSMTSSRVYKSTMSFIALGSALVHRIIQSFFPNSRDFGMSTPSTEEDYRNLPLSKLELEGISFEDFGCAEGDYIDELCKKEGVSFRERIAIHNVWSDHPKRTQLTPPSQEGKHLLLYMEGTQCDFMI